MSKSMWTSVHAFWASAKHRLLYAGWEAVLECIHIQAQFNCFRPHDVFCLSRLKLLITADVNLSSEKSGSHHQKWLSFWARGCYQLISFPIRQFGINCSDFAINQQFRSQDDVLNIKIRSSALPSLYFPKEQMRLLVRFAMWLSNSAVFHGSPRETQLFKTFLKSVASFT